MEDVAHQKLNYKRLAYCVLRDALGFYLGIPLFLVTCEDTRADAVKFFVEQKCSLYTTRSGKTPTEAQIKQYTQNVEKRMERRLQELLDDFSYAESVLFEDNIWLNLVDYDPSFYRNFLERLTDVEVLEMAIVPSWVTSDYDLGRKFIKDSLSIVPSDAYERPKGKLTYTT